MLQLSSLLLLFFACTRASPVAAPICYEEDPELPALTPTDCLYSMLSIRNDEFFTISREYGIDENSPRDVPIDWPHNTCLMSVTALDAGKTDTFALADTMPAFKALFETCLKRKKPGHGFGGYIPIGHGKEFYAVVQYNPDFPFPKPEERLLSSLNGIDNTTASQLLQTS